TLNSFFRGNGQGLLIAAIFDQVSLVVADVRAVMEAGGVKRARRNLIQGLFQALAVSREILLDLAGGRVDSDAVCRPHRIQNLGARSADADGVLHHQMHVVEKEGDKALRVVWRMRLVLARLGVAITGGYNRNRVA